MYGRNSDNTIAILCIVLLVAVVTIPGVWLKAATDQNLFETHQANAQSAVRWSPGSIDDAKRVVTQFLEESKTSGEVKLSGSGLLYGYREQGQQRFSNFDICLDDVQMLLSKKDFLAYRIWLKKISKPYVKGERMLTPPYLPAPWDK